MNLQDIPEAFLPSVPPLAPSPIPALSPAPPSPSFGPSSLTLSYHLPDGTPLLHTLATEFHLNQLFAGDQMALPGIYDFYQAAVFLWFCAHPPAPGQPPLWNAPGPNHDGTILPLFLRPADIITTALTWLSQRLPAGDSLGLMILADKIWQGHNAADVIPDPSHDTDAPNVPLKKNGDSNPLPLSSSSISSPEETPSIGISASTSSPSIPPSPSGTVTFSSLDSPSSPPPPIVPAAPVTPPN